MTSLFDDMEPREIELNELHRRNQQVIGQFGLHLVKIPLVDSYPDVMGYFLVDTQAKKVGPYLEFFDAFVGAVAIYRENIVQQDGGECDES